MTAFRQLVLVVLFSCLALTAQAAESTGPRVVVSIKPLHALVAGVMDGVAEPELLVTGGNSPHGYLLRPSQARNLTHAQLVVWVGDQLESFLSKPLATLGGQAQQLKLADVFADQLLPLRQHGNWEAHSHHDEENKTPDHDQLSAAEKDQHLWLDPRLAQQIVAKTAARLVEIDPVHQQQYRTNAARLSNRLEQLHLRLQKKLAPAKGIPYLVFHDAYQYFEAAYGLDAVGAVSIDPDRKPGARRIADLRAKIVRLQARCLFSEPQFEPRLVKTIAAGSTIRTGVLDPLGAQLPAGPESYFQLLNNLADNLLAGLGLKP